MTTAAIIAAFIIIATLWVVWWAKDRSPDDPDW
jgi:hypothetical protein